MKPRYAIPIGLLAGIAGGLMALAGFQAGMAALLLLFAAPVAVYIAALGWGTVSGFLAAVVATGVAAYDGSLTAAVTTGGLLFLPAAWSGHLANLAQPDPTGRGLLWYPLSGILARLMAALALGFIATGWAAGISIDGLATELATMLREISAARPEGEAAPQIDIEATARVYGILLPAMMPAVWLMLHVLVFNLAAIVTRRSGLLARPAEDIAANANLPPWALAFPIGGVAGMFLLDGAPQDIAAVFAGTGIAGFGLVGLAEMHLASRGKPGRGLLLFGAWLLLALFSLPLLVFAAIGARRSLRQTGSAGSTT